MSTQAIYKTAAGEQTIKTFYNGILAQWPAPRERLMVPTCCGETFVMANGRSDAPPLVLLHGSSTNSATWMGDVAAYSAHFRVYAVDTPGEPGHSAPQRHSLTGPAYADWLADVLDELDAPRAALVGMSQGGWMALKFATTYPDRVTRLALIAPGGIVSMKLGTVLKIVAVSLFGQWGVDRVQQMVYRDVHVPAPVQTFADLIARHYNPRTDPQPNFSDAELQRLKMPLLLLVGEHDCFFDARKMVARLQAVLPHANGRLLLDEGHVLLHSRQDVLPFLVDVRGKEGMPA